MADHRRLCLKRCLFAARLHVLGSLSQYDLGLLSATSHSFTGRLLVPCAEGEHAWGLQGVPTRQSSSPEYLILDIIDNLGGKGMDRLVSGVQSTTLSCELVTSYTSLWRQISEGDRLFWNTKRFHTLISSILMMVHFPPLI